jgi:ERCC4-type nuclease
MAYTNFEIDRCVESMVLLVDTREQPTKRLKKRLEATGLPYERQKLAVGDYSCKCTLPGEESFDFSTKVVIERKMNLDELCMCFGKERPRFEREFERAAEAGTKVYLLVEGDNWEKAYNGKYRSLLKPQALVASIDAFRARYGMQLDFCKPETTGKLIRDILHRELKEYLQRCD